ncbi:MAG: acyclic terpene utilization AtuA family protein [Chloroflexota bacterium]
MKRVRVGVGAGFSGDRLDAALPLVERGEIGYLVFECLAERTIALAQKDRLKDRARGYHPFLEERLRRVLAACKARGVKIVSNMGAANPKAAGERAAAVARELGISGYKVAVVTGDDVLDVVRGGDYVAAETGQRISELADVVSANAYLGIEPIRQALEQGADLVLTGRVADPSLILAPAAHEHGWSNDDWQRLGAGTIVGHLLECAAQVTGGYFADPGYKDVPNLSDVGYPIAEIEATGEALVMKTPQTGGIVSTATCKEQLLYELHDPARYLTPDVTADFSGVRLAQADKDVVRVTGGSGTARPDTLKVTVGYRAGWIGEAQVSYGGPGAAERARLAGQIVLDRLEYLGVQPIETRAEAVGVDSLYPGSGPVRDRAVAGAAAPYEARIRVAARVRTQAEAEMVVHEVDSLGLNGPSGGSIAAMGIREVLGVVSTFVPRDLIRPRVTLTGSRRP